MTIRAGVVLASLTLAIHTLAASMEPDSVRNLPKGGVLLQATVDSAIVLIDGEWKGVTPLRLDSLTAGSHYVTVLHPDIESWFTGSIRDTLRVLADTTLVIRYDLGNRYFVSSEPDGAGVYAGDSLIGQTPLVLQGMNAELLPSLRLRREGFAEGRPAHTSDTPFLLSASLQPEWSPEQLHDHEMLRLENGTNGLPLYITGAATVLSGTAAAYFKTKADRRYQQYLLTNDPTLLSQTRSLDTAAVVALVTTQVSLALLAYFLLNE